ncbi:MAG: hypothetical protein E7552_02510 [Ruminococcaceae bacterium]|nr:hypothetical protein [Oscillospiraceae bacterium]
MKKWLSILLAVCMAVSLCPSTLPCVTADSLISAEILEGKLTHADVESVTVAPITVFEHTFGEELSAASETYYCYCNWTAFLSYTIELKNGDVIEAPKGYFRYDGARYDLFSAHAHKDRDACWEVGNTYTERVRILGEECDVSITVVPSPVVDLEIEPITILEGTKCDTAVGSAGEYCVYRWYEDMPWKLTLNDGKTFESTAATVMIDAKNYPFEYSDDQSSQNHWKAGETHVCRVKVLGFSVDVPVTITDTPIKNVVFEDIVVYENADGMYASQYNPEFGRDEEYFRYIWSPYISYEAITADGEKITGSGSGIGLGDTYYDFEWNDPQSLFTKWTVGNTYGVGIAVGGKTYTVSVRVEENPVESVQIANIVIPQGMNASTTLAYDVEGNKHVEYLQYDITPLLDYKVVFKDGTITEADRYGFDYNGRHYGAVIQTQQNHDNTWQPDKIYYATVSVMGNSSLVPVYIKPIAAAEGFAYTVRNGNATVTECHKTDEALVIPEKIGDYTVTELQNIADAENFTALYLHDSIESLSWIDFTAFEALETIYYEGDEYHWRDVSKHYNGFGDITIVFNYSFAQEKAETPVFSAKTSTTVTLAAVAGMEYSRDGIHWQTSPVFTNLLCETEYTFYQRYHETEWLGAGEVSEALTVTTDTHKYSNPLDSDCNICGAVREMQKTLLGDVDDSGRVDSTDARLTLQYAVMKIPADQLDLTVADVNGDSKTDSTDARLILQYAVKKIDKLPAA